MALSMIQFSYKSDNVMKLLKNPEDRSTAVKQLIEKLGGKLLAFYYSYGEYDGLIIVDMPDQTSGLAATMTSFASGGTSRLKTTILISVDEALVAMKEASGLKLEQPKG
jgi:uncharacterized protein with GYD domain